MVVTPVCWPLMSATWSSDRYGQAPVAGAGSSVGGGGCAGDPATGVAGAAGAAVTVTERVAVLVPSVTVIVDSAAEAPPPGPPAEQPAATRATAVATVAATAVAAVAARLDRAHGRDRTIGRPPLPLCANVRVPPSVPGTLDLPGEPGRW
jgi:hypothetical protein